MKPLEHEPAKALLQAIPGGGAENDSFFVRNYNMNLYRGCSHGCVYCDARSVCYQLERPGEVRAKADALPILREELRRRRTPGIVGMGGMSDSYNPWEAQAELTRGALALLAQNAFGVGITTKSPLVARDIDLLRAIQKNAPAHVTFSITTANDRLAKRLEPGVARSSVRFAAMERIARAGIPVGMWLNPMLPFLTDSEENVRELLRMARDAGARYVLTHYGMTLREGNREYFYAALDRDFPGMKARYAQAYGLSYEVPVPNAEALHRLFTAECKRLGLACTFAETNRIITRSAGYEQVSLL
ncbi:radical SAM protein [Eubacteriales bacterium OttesenSCG-928-A19]|nr:radical SAM protein [Eubacteriales bacterium OttesenSCG-928-A19]